jgi:hypothetical protein|tara:strand:- start:951 stop:1136 length:186 start_codon:yes stop_codon:yes gene_type:complete
MMQQSKLRRFKLKEKFKEMLIPVVREFTHHEIDILVKEAIADYCKQMETVDVIREKRRKNV